MTVSPVSPALDRRFREAAAAAGLLDVAYDLTDSPIGTLLVATTDRGLCRISFDPEPDRMTEELARAFGARVLRAAGPIEPVRRQLDEYFDGRRQSFDLPVDWALTAGFTRKVLQATARVPFGHLTTYADVAARAGSPRGMRAAGNALGSNPIPIVVPCHRVVRTGGGIGGYTGGIDRKRHLLRLEGVPTPEPALPD
jgi:methylated-DNA-[protein]-cysteine S-methyltransferase